MFFLVLSISFIMLSTGVIQLANGSYLTGSLSMSGSLLMIYLMMMQYGTSTQKRKEEEEEDNDSMFSDAVGEGLECGQSKLFDCGLNSLNCKIPDCD